MNYTKKIILTSLAFISITLTNLALADTNKDTTIATINSSISNITNDKTGTGKVQILKSAVYDLSASFSTLYTSLGYDDKTISYLVSLGKLTTDYKKDLTTEYTNLKNELDSKYAENISSLNALKDEIDLNYTTLSAEQKSIYQTKINTINTSYNAINVYADTRIASIKTKYKSNLATLQSTLSSVVKANQTKLDSIKLFDTRFSNLASMKEKLDTNYSNFKNNYLGGISTLTDFLATKKTYYSDLMKTQLQKMIDLNVESNPGLADYKTELYDYAAFLANKFALNLEKNVDDNYSIIYSQSKMDAINTSYSEFKTKYIDINGLVKAQDFLANTGAINDIGTLTTSVNDLNSKLDNLTVTGATNIENIKIILENQLIEYYNSQFSTHKTTLLAKMKESLLDLTTVNDLIDTKYASYSLAIASGATLTYFDIKTKELKEFLAKYENSRNTVIKKKIKKIYYFIDNNYIVRELENTKYKYYTKSKTSYDEQIEAAMKSLDKKFGDSFVEKMDIVFANIDKALANTKLSTKTTYKLKVIKLGIRNYIYKNKM
ncbi:MAG: hypothetical protein PHR68_03405 [Candidatus Gracilibacteria bacterium]|nr:hypothetical protein [Candidatus Gracilibacteria bacterium]